MIYLFCFILFLIGVYCVVVKRDIVKIIVGLSIMDYATFLLLVVVGYKFEGRAPIYDPVQKITNMVDPIPQALVLTAIVIGVAVLGLVISVGLRLYEKYGTFDINEIRKLRG